VSAIVAVAPAREREEERDPEPQQAQTPAPEATLQRVAAEPATRPQSEQAGTSAPESLSTRAAEQAVDSALASATLFVADPVSATTVSASHSISVSSAVAAPASETEGAPRGVRAGEDRPSAAFAALRARLPVLHLATRGQGRALANVTTRAAGIAAALFALGLTVVGWRAGHRNETAVAEEMPALPDHTSAFVVRPVSSLPDPASGSELPGCQSSAETPACPCADRPASPASSKRAVTAPQHAPQAKPRLTWPSTARGAHQRDTNANPY
jgi:hypothetical protein